MSERKSLYQGVEAEPVVTVVESAQPATEERKVSKAQLLREEMRPVIESAKKKLAEKVLAPLQSVDWQTYALCAYLPPHERERFTSGHQEDTQRAKLVCESCDVRAECLAYALANHETFYVYGGKSEKERRSLKRADAANRRWERLNRQ